MLHKFNLVYYKKKQQRSETYCLNIYSSQTICIILTQCPQNQSNISTRWNCVGFSLNHKIAKRKTFNGPSKMSGWNIFHPGWPFSCPARSVNDVYYLVYGKWSNKASRQTIWRLLFELASWNCEWRLHWTTPHLILMFCLIVLYKVSIFGRIHWAV